MQDLHIIGDLPSFMSENLFAGCHGSFVTDTNFSVYVILYPICEGVHSTLKRLRCFLFFSILYQKFYELVPLDTT